MENTTFLLRKKRPPRIEEVLARIGIINELHKLLSSTMLPKGKGEKLYVSLDFENDQTIEALVDSWG